MRRVKSKMNKSTELRLIEIFKKNRITGWRRNYPVKGHPDFVFLEKKVVFGMDMTVGILGPLIIKNTGSRNENEISNTIKQ